MVNNKAAKETSLLTAGIAFIIVGLTIIQQSLDPINTVQIMVGVCVAAVGIIIIYIWRIMGPSLKPSVQGFIAFLDNNDGIINYLQDQIEAHSEKGPDNQE